MRRNNLSYSRSWATGPTPHAFALDPAVGVLDIAAGSFQLDTADLPPAPPYA